MTKNAALALLLVVAACSTFGEGADAVAPSPGEDGGADGGGNASPPDAAVADAPSDTGPAESCVRAISDSWSANSLGTFWTTETNGGGEISVDSAGGLQGGALRARIKADGAYGVARAEKIFGGPLPKRAILSFALKMSAVSPGAYFHPGCTLQARVSNDTFFAVSPVMSDGELRVEVQSRKNGDIDPSKSGALGMATLAKWYVIRLELAGISTAGAHATLSIDGKTFVDEAVQFPEPPVDLRVKCGVDYSDANDVSESFVDDVVFDVCE